MLLAINAGKTLADLQEKFSECFPHLRLQFYAHPHHWKAASAPRQQLNPQQSIGAVSAENGVLDIKSWYQIGRVEQDFHRQFGLNVQIFRNENGAWVQTTENDSLALRAAAPQPGCQP